MREQMGDRLTPAAVLELQRILTADTFDGPDASGRLQTPDEERVVVVDRTDGGVLHRPPPAQQLPDRLQALCDFANGDSDDEESFIHPVVRAILLHFWLAYDHPFVDGNGRTARVLFFWSLRTKGYWLVEYLSISKILREAPGKYNRAFLLTETDEGDTTYFLLHQLTSSSARSSSCTSTSSARSPRFATWSSCCVAPAASTIDRRPSLAGPSAIPTTSTPSPRTPRATA